MKIQVDAGIYTTTSKIVPRQLYKDDFGFYIKQRGCFPIATEKSGAWEIEHAVPGNIAFYRRNNHTESNKV